MQRESDKRRSWKNKERERWDLKRLLDEQKNNVFSQALALAILNGTADKMELEKREKEENEYSSLSSRPLIKHWLPNVSFSLLLRAWVRKTDADLEAAAKAAQLEEDREIPILPYSSLFILSSNNKWVRTGGLWHTGSSGRNLKDKGLFKVLRGRIKTMKKSLAWCWVLKNLSTKTIYKVEP